MASLTATQLAKASLRNEIKLKISNISVPLRYEKSDDICKKLLESDIWATCKSLSLYISTDTEVQTKPLFLSAFSKGMQVYVPRYSGPVMEMVKLSNMDDLNSLPLNKWNIPQPLMSDMTREILEPTDCLDLIIVPGLAFSIEGKRLGKGKGYYDKFLSHYSQNNFSTKPVFVALAFKEQIVLDLPTSSFDVLIDKLITD